MPNDIFNISTIPHSIDGPITNSSDTIFADKYFLMDQLLDIIKRHKLRLPNNPDILDYIVYLFHFHLDIVDDTETPLILGINADLVGDIAYLVRQAGLPYGTKDIILAVDNRSEHKDLQLLVNDLINMLKTIPLDVIYDNDPTYTYTVFMLMCKRKTSKYFSKFIEERIVEYDGITYNPLSYLDIDYITRTDISYYSRHKEMWMVTKFEKLCMKFCEERRKERNERIKK